MSEIWLRDQLLVAFSLYCRIPFAKTKANNPSVVAVAQLIGRSPASVAMKLGNFGSFDPALQIKGIRGLSKASRADREIWDEFNQDWEKLSVESKIATQRFQVNPTTIVLESEKVKRRNGDALRVEDGLCGPSEGIREVKVRLHQRFFREAVLASYDNSCCVCANPIPQLLTAGHIIPWADREDLRANPKNGLCLCSLHHDAFDCGLWTIVDTYEIKLSSRLMAYLPNRTLELGFLSYSQTKIRMPDKFWPDNEFLAFHHANVFLE